MGPDPDLEREGERGVGGRVVRWKLGLDPDSPRRLRRERTMFLRLGRDVFHRTLRQSAHGP